MSEQTAKPQGADDSACHECLILRKNAEDARRSLHSYQPMHLASGYRPRSRWFKDDKRAVEGLERVYNLAEAKYNMHLTTEHSKGQCHDAQGFVRNFNVIMRNGRLKP